MTREIKFRGKSTEPQNKGKFVFGFYRQYNIMKPCGNCLDHVNHFIDEPNGRSYYVDKKTIGQFTGLLDIDRVEIFEGDIVDYVCDGTQQGVIVYDNFGCVSIEFGDDEYLQTIDARLLGTMEVIGNIHDNPELLKIDNNEKI